MSRDGDDTIIWSFLISESASKDPVKIWKSQEGRKINTGFLLSSAPRIQGCPGLSWAPSTPTVRLPKVVKGSPSDEKTYLAFDSANTQDGTITAEGLWGRWLIHRFSPATVSQGLANLPQPSLQDGRSTSFNRIIRKYSQGDNAVGALLLPCGVRSEGLKAVAYRGGLQGTLLAVCSMSASGQGYVWKGVVEWAVEEPLPEFSRETILLV